MLLIYVSRAYETAKFQIYQFFRSTSVKKSTGRTQNELIATHAIGASFENSAISVGPMFFSAAPIASNPPVAFTALTCNLIVTCIKQFV